MPTLTSPLRRRIGVVAAAAIIACLGTSAPAAADAVIMAAGDIACASPVAKAQSCRQQYTSDLLLAQRASPEGLSAVLALGDNQYETGALADYTAYFGSTWGRLGSIVHPVPGNHEYDTPDAKGYFDYFDRLGMAVGQRRRGYYSFDLAGWHLIALNSNCGQIGGCQRGSAQETWLRADLGSPQARAATCTLAYWHHPRFSSGPHGAGDQTAPLWNALYESGADLVLVGHDHLYERYGHLGPTGLPDPARGIREFVVGTGGKSLYRIDPASARGEILENDTFGVLKLTLRSGGYDWRFVPEAGRTFSDSGSDTCHRAASGAPVPPPAPPGGSGTQPAPRLRLRAPRRQSVGRSRRVHAVATTDTNATVIFSGAVLDAGRRIPLGSATFLLRRDQPRRVERRLPPAALAAVRRAARSHHRVVARLVLRMRNAPRRYAVLRIALAP